MKNFIKDLEDKLKKNIQLSKIEIIDNTHLHRTHKSFKKGKYHISLIITSEELRLLNKISAHKKIMKVLSVEIKNKIHALEIKIK